MTCSYSIVISAFLLISFLPLSASRGQSKPQPGAMAEAASLEGTVVDGNTNRAIVGASVLARNPAGKVSAQQRVGPDGSFHLALDPKQTYIITTSADGYYPLDEQLAFTSTYTNRLYGKVIRLYRAGGQPPVRPATAGPVQAATNPAVANAAASPATARVTPPKTLDAKVTYTPPLVVAPAGKTTQLRAIQFVQSKTELLPDAQPALEQLLAFLRDHPTTEIELGGHTDNQGDFDENLRLSKQRVEVVKDYLVKNGIAAGRISTRGYGPTRPIASNNSESTRQQNRRVEMTVIRP